MSSDDESVRRPRHRRRELTPERMQHSDQPDWRNTVRHLSRQPVRPSGELRLGALRRLVLGNDERPAPGEADSEHSGTGSDCGPTEPDEPPSDGGSEGVGEYSHSSMSDSSNSSSEEDRRALRKMRFHPGVDDPAEFWQALEFMVADGTAGHNNRSMIGKLVRCMRDHPARAEVVLVWKQRNEVPGGVGAALPIIRAHGMPAATVLATRVQIRAAFVAAFPQLGSRDKSD